MPPAVGWVGVAALLESAKAAEEEEDDTNDWRESRRGMKVLNGECVRTRERSMPRSPERY
jgi:hypothetical protein